MKQKSVRETVDNLPAIDPETGLPVGYGQTAASMCEPLHVTTAELLEEAEARKGKEKNGQVRNLR